MIVLGAVLLLLALLLLLGIGFTNSVPLPDFAVFGFPVGGMTAGRLFVAGVITGAVAMFALSLILGGGARKAHKRVQRKREVRSVRGQAESLEQENARLREELAGTGRTSTSTVSEEPRRGLFGR